MWSWNTWTVESCKSLIARSQAICYYRTAHAKTTITTSMDNTLSIQPTGGLSRVVRILCQKNWTLWAPFLWILRKFCTLFQADLFTYLLTWKRTEIRLLCREPHWADQCSRRSQTPNSRLESMNPIPNPCWCLLHCVSNLNTSKPSPSQSSPAHPCLLDLCLSKTHCQLATATLSHFPCPCEHAIYCSIDGIMIVLCRKLFLLSKIHKKISCI